MRIRVIVPVAISAIAAVMPQALMSQALADTRDDILAAIQRCGVIHDNKVWLDCAYGAIQPMRAQLGLQPAPEYQQRLVPPPQTAIVAPVPPAAAAPPARVASRPGARKRHGFFDNLLNAPPVTVAKMASYHYEKNGAFVIALDNGEQWRQVDPTSSVSWNNPPASYTVTVTEGAFGTYSLRTSDSPNIYKVELVK